ncbi:MAG: ABC transporter ATP-binding protein [Geodermatophilaceae bacterium]|nr:ABC transporter ATP-binding protein [Geodermatophilaceae bacterium]
MLDIQGLSVSFRQPGRRSRIEAVSDLDLTLAPGESVALVGGSGAGKTTVARAIAGLVRPDRGAILLDGIDLLAVRPAEARRLRRALHLVFQDPYAALPPNLRVADIVAEPLIIHGVTDGEQRRARVREALVQVRLEPVEQFLPRYPHQLSGGERQRVAFARALVGRPRLILADEPTQMLDASLRLDLIKMVAQLGAQQNVAVLHITHDLALAQHGCTRVVVMHAGRVVEQGLSTAVLSAPQHNYTAALVAASTHVRSI